MKIKKQEDFELTTEIKVSIKWKEKAENEKILEERKKFESKITDLANFLNSDLGKMLLQGFEQAEKIKNQMK